MNVKEDTMKNLVFIVKEWAKSSDLKQIAESYDCAKHDEEMKQILDNGGTCWGIDHSLGLGATDWLFETRNILRMIKRGEIKFEEEAI
jgi:hypothetical protein